MGVGLAAEFVFAAGGRAIGVVNEDVVAASGAQDAIDRFGELAMPGVEGVIGFGFSASHWDR